MPAIEHNHPHLASGVDGNLAIRPLRACSVQPAQCGHAIPSVSPATALQPSGISNALLRSSLGRAAFGARSSDSLGMAPRFLTIKSEMAWAGFLRRPYATPSHNSEPSPIRPAHRFAPTNARPDPSPQFNVLPLRVIEHAHRNQRPSRWPCASTSVRAAAALPLRSGPLRPRTSTSASWLLHSVPTP